jgi:hypothetical protein
MNGFQQVLEQACTTVGFDADDARLLRLGSNAVYHLKVPVIARISRPGADVAQVRCTVAVARWLESEHYPAVRVIDVDQPVRTSAASAITSAPSATRSTRPTPYSKGSATGS